MGIYTNLNNYLVNQIWILESMIYSFQLIILILFSFALLHAFYGTAHPFPITMCISVILNIFFYFPFSYICFKNNNLNEYLYYIAFVIMMLSHWVLAYRYHKSTVEMPYVMNGKIVPKKILLFNKILLWVTIVMILLSATFCFFREPFQPNLFWTLFITTICLIAMMTTLMLVALF